MRALLDVNVLLALLDRDHVDHERARAWITGQIERGWASCAITQNGFVRVISQPRYPSPISVAHAIDLLARATHALSRVLVLHRQHSRLKGHRSFPPAQPQTGHRRVLAGPRGRS